MQLCSLAQDASQAKLSKIASNIFERRENLLKNGVLHIIFRISQLSEIKPQSKYLRKRKKPNF